jgi:hypothetical protein
MFPQFHSLLMKKSGKPLVLPLVIFTIFIASQLLVVSLPSTAGYTASTTPSPFRTMPIGLASTSNANHPFAFVSNFENMKLDGWTKVSGSTPVVVSSPNYSGEPSLKSSATKGSQVDYANSQFKLGQSQLSFEVAINVAAGAKAYFGIGSSTTNFVAVIGVANGYVYGGSSLTKLQKIGAIPSGTAYPSGWVYIVTDITQSNGKWVMAVYVDQTNTPNANINVPNLGSYTGALIETQGGNAYYSDITVSTYQMAITISGYNNMEGYGQGSALLVKLLPSYNNLTAVMTLNKWSVPQSGILSFQINAMNYTGTTQSTCVGFFQLGMWLGQNGQIEPWYVPGENCEANFFTGPISTPQGTHLVLSIIFKPSSHEIEFKEVDTSISKTYETTIYYGGGAFYGAYTQMEFQPCCASYPIKDYKLQGSIFGLQITKTDGKTIPLPASYMVPFVLDAPTTWQLQYYRSSQAGYHESSI